MTKPFKLTRPAKDIETVVAFVSDIGGQSAEQAKVAAVACRFKPELFISGGDNNYLTSDSGLSLADQYTYSLKVYEGLIAAGQMITAIGNHDMDQDSGDAMLAHFGQTETYFEHVVGDASFFVLNSGKRTDGTLIEPDGISSTSDQALWLEDAVSRSQSFWKIVVCHHSPYTSSSGNAAVTELQWDFEAMGIDLVISGHHHHYERLIVDGIPYIVCGSGGGSSLVDFSGTPDTSISVVRHKDFGALRLGFKDTQLRVKFYDKDNLKQDDYLIEKTYT